MQRPETWKLIPDMYYEVSSWGAIRCSYQHPETPGRRLPTIKGRGGYLFVYLDGERYSVARLVLLIHGRGLGFGIRYRDRNRSNCRLENLKVMESRDYVREFRIKSTFSGDKEAEDDEEDSPPTSNRLKSFTPQQLDSFWVIYDTPGRDLEMMARILSVSRATLYRILKKVKEGGRQAIDPRQG